MKQLMPVGLMLLLLFSGGHAQTPTDAATDAAELTRLLNEFLAGASRNDAAIHNRFWADELVYTGSGGRRRNKADVMKDVRSAPPPKPGDPTTTYTAEDVQIQQYSDTAIVAFKLVGTTARDGSSQVANFFNTGTFIKRNGKWQVVAWQATRIPRSAADSEKEVRATQAAFHQAMLAADVKRLESLTDETFIWTHNTGQQVTRKELLEQFSSGRVKYVKLETHDVNVKVYGDTAVVRGISPRQRVPYAGPGGSDGKPFDVFYTLTFTNQGGDWKVVAMHTSKPDSPQTKSP